MQIGGNTFTTGAATDKGCVREENEDSFLVASHLGVWAVADGMGGHEHGRLASQLVVKELERIRPAQSAAELREHCEAAVLAANARVQGLSSARGGVTIGSTLVALLIHEKFYACIWSGDSRMYLLRGGQITALTRDHTELADLIAKGVLTDEEARNWPRRHVITRAIGVAPEPELEMISGTLEDEDTFVLSSDGLTTHVNMAEIGEIVATQEPQAACDRLLQLTLERGGTDNVTMVIVRTRTKETTLVQARPVQPISWDPDDDR